MSKNASFVLFLGIFFVPYAGLTQETKSSDNYVIEVERPVEGEEVAREFDARGKVIINPKGISQDILLVSIIKPATYPRYYIQSRTILKFTMKNGDYEADWLSHCWVGSPNDYGKKFYLYIFLLEKKYLRELEDMDEKSSEDGIGEGEFKKDFLDVSNNYFVKTKPIQIYRKFE